MLAVNRVKNKLAKKLCIAVTTEELQKVLHHKNTFRAAFEAVSRTRIQRISRASFIDVRTARLPLETPELDDFDPQLHRDPKNPIKLWMAYFNLLRTAFGAGVLGFPMAISQAGIILGPILAMATGFLIVHTHRMLLRCLNEVSRQLRIPYISYRYGFRLALLHGPEICQFIGHRGPTIIATFMILSQLGICSVFVCFTSDSLRDIMDWPSSQIALLALLLPYLLLECFMKTLKHVSYVSLMGNLLNLVGLVLVFYHIFEDPHGEYIDASTDALPVLMSVGTFFFNLSAVGVVLSLDKALVNPKVLTEKFGVLDIGILIPTTIATIFGVLGYWSFGTMEENILRSLPFDADTAMVAIGLYLIAVAFAHPIQCYPGIQIVLEVIKNRDLAQTPSDQTMKSVETVARPCFVLASFLVCYLVPFQGPFIAFVGNLCTTLLALVFPAMMEISLMYPGPYGKYKFYLYKNLFLIFIGLFTWAYGAVLSGYLIYVRILVARSPNDVDT